MVGIGGWRFWRRRDLGWWIVAVNQIGSILFMVSAVASFVRPSSGDELAVGVANWGTLLGALCFAVAGLMQEFEPLRARAADGRHEAPRWINCKGRYPRLRFLFGWTTNSPDSKGDNRDHGANTGPPCRGHRKGLR